MSDKPKYTVTTQGDTQYILIPVEITPKGVKSITFYLDEFELSETGTKQKGKLPVAYHKYRLKEK